MSETDEPAMTLSSVHVGVEDMERALDFYRAVFETEPEQAEERFSTFEFGDYRTFQFVDTEDNTVEVLSVDA